MDDENLTTRSLKDLVADCLPELGETFLGTDVWSRLVKLPADTLRPALQAAASDPKRRRSVSFSKALRGQDYDGTHLHLMLVDATLRGLGCSALEYATAVVDGDETITELWAQPTQAEPRLAGQPDATADAAAVSTAAEREARMKHIDDGIEQMARLAAEEDDDDDEDDPGPQSRGVVVLDRRLSSLESHLRERNMLVIVAPADDIDDAARPWLLACRVLIVTDEQPFVYDASSYEIGIISVRLLSNRDPKHVTKVISNALVRRKLWHKRHGFLLLLSDDGQHEYEPLVD